MQVIKNHYTTYSDRAIPSLLNYIEITLKLCCRNTQKLISSMKSDISLLPPPSGSMLLERIYDLSMETEHELGRLITNALSQIQLPESAKDFLLTEIIDFFNSKSRNEPFWETDYNYALHYMKRDLYTYLKNKNWTTLYKGNSDKMIELAILNFSLSTKRNTSLRNHFQEVLARKQIKYIHDFFTEYVTGLEYVLYHVFNNSLKKKGRKLYIERHYTFKKNKDMSKLYASFREDGAFISPAFVPSIYIPINEAIENIYFMGVGDNGTELSNSNRTSIKTMLTASQENYDGMDTINQLIDSIAMSFCELASYLWMNYKNLKLARKCMNFALQCGCSVDVFHEIKAKDYWLKTVKKKSWF